MNGTAVKLLELIKNAKISYNELSIATGIPKSALQRYATGETEKIPLDRIEKLAQALDTTVAYLLGWNIDQIKEKLATQVWVDEQAQQNIEIFNSLSPDKKEEALRYLRYLASIKASDK